MKVKSKACRSRDPRLQSIVEGDVLDTVSQRDPRIKSVDVWTMGNRVFACENTEAFLKIASAWSERRPILDAVASGSSDYSEEVIEQLRFLVDAESRGT